MFSAIPVKRIRQILNEAKQMVIADPSMGVASVEITTIEIYQNRVFELVLSELEKMEEAEEAKRIAEEEAKKKEEQANVDSKEHVNGEVKSK